MGTEKQNLGWFMEWESLNKFSLVKFRGEEFVKGFQDSTDEEMSLKIKRIIARKIKIPRKGILCIKLCKVNKISYV